MAFGFPPKYTQDIALGDLTSGHFLMLAREIAKKLEWNISTTAPTEFVAFTGFSMGSWSEQFTIKIENGAASLTSKCTSSQLFDWGKNRRNIENFIELFNELKNFTSAEELQQKHEELQQQLDSREGTEAAIPAAPELSTFAAMFKPREGYFITPILVYLNIAVFILMVLSGVNFMLPDTDSLLNWGANFRPLTLGGEWWRLITNFFLHIGILHLLMNMYALIYIGLLLEPYMGKARFAAAYMLTGIAASVASLWWHDLIVSAGASGAIFGMYGVFLALLTTNFIEKSMRQALLTSIGVFVAYNLMNGMKGGIDNAAHIGGLISGLIIGYAMIPSLKKPAANNLKFGTIGAVTVLVLVSSFVVYKSIPNDIGKYEEKMQGFVSNEAEALEVYKLPKDSSNEKYLNSLKNHGINYWNDNLKLIAEVETYNLPDALHQKDAKLKKYCELRIQCYELIYKAISENTQQYKDQIDDYNKQIETIIDELGGGEQTK